MEPIISDKLAGIETFTVVVQAGNFAAAATRLRVTRSAVAKSIARLEARLGTRLFVRTTRSQSLTDGGQAYYDRCMRALSELEAARTELEMGRSQPAGRIRISTPVIFGRRHVAPVLQNLAQRHPLLEFEASFTDRLADFVEDGIDLAIRSGALPDSGTMVARALGRQWMVVCASPAYVAKHGRPRTLRDLDAHHAIMYKRNGQVFPWTFHDEQGRDVQKNMSYRIGYDDLDAITSAAVDGAGLARLPNWLVFEHMRENRLLKVLDETRPFGSELHVVWPHTRYLPQKSRVVIDALLKAIPPKLSLCTYGMDDKPENA